MFEDSFVDHLFNLVEQTRDVQDETFNYSVIKLIVSSELPSLFILLKVSAGGLERTVYGSTASCKCT